MIQVDYSRDELIDAHAMVTLKDRYMIEGDTSPQDAFARAAMAFSDDETMAQRIYDYVSKQWLSLATPVLSNAPERVGWSDSWERNFDPLCFKESRGLPISCFLNYVPDSRGGLGEHYTENIWLGSMGGGIGGYWGHVRSDGTSTSTGSRSTGSIPFLKVVDSEILAISQGVTRRGSYAAYYDISHPEVLEFLDTRKPTGGDLNRKALNLHQGLNLTNKFMRIIEQCEGDPDADDDWELIDPHSKEVVKIVSARYLWQKILDLRMQTGEPFIIFIDTVNESLRSELREAGLMVHHSNLCTEIMLATNEDRTAVCCLSSVNVEKVDEWIDNSVFIEDVVRLLDNVLEYFIQNAPPAMHRAIYSARTERSIGIGQLGWHYLLMSKNIPFESAQASGLNRKIAKHIFEHAELASQKLADERGEPELLEGSGDRNAHLIAIAPNASTSVLLSTSPSIEPVSSNIYTHKTMSGSWTVKNKYLDNLIKEKYPDDYDAVWKEVLQAGGSIQANERFSEWEKSVFKTAFEIDQQWIVDHAAVRQKYVCQSQSVNLFLEPTVPVQYAHGLLMQAWKRGVKSLYYQRTKAIRRAEDVSQKVERKYIVNDSECLSCEG